MPPKKKEPKFEGDAAFVNASLELQLEERDRTINRLENKHVILEKCYTQVYLALEEAAGMADRFHQFIENAERDERSRVRSTAEMSRYARLFRDAKDAFQRARA